MGIIKQKREVDVEAIQCDREGCTETVAPQFEPMKGWTAICAMEIVQRAGFQPNPGDSRISKYLCPGCSTSIAVTLRSSVQIQRSASPSIPKVCREGRCSELAQPGGFYCAKHGGEPENTW